MLAAFVARVPLRVATGYRWYSVLANRRVYQHRREFSKHESEYNLGLLAGLGLDPGPPAVPRLVLTHGEREWARLRLRGLPPQRVVVHPGGFSTRRWRSQHYLELAQRLAREGCGVILTGSMADEKRVRDEVPEATSMGSQVLDLMGQLTLRELMSVIGASQAVVSGSTGPAHVAAALGIPTVMDRVCQQALVQVLLPIFGPTFREASFGYRPGRSTHMAMRRIWRQLEQAEWIVDGDISDFFGSLSHERLVDLVADRVADGKVLSLIRSMLTAGALVDGVFESVVAGVPQGGVASPLLSNIYLTVFDEKMA